MKFLIFISVVFLSNCLQAQDFNGIIYKTITHDSSPITKTLGLNSGHGESEHLFFRIRNTICKDTIIGQAYGRDSLFNYVTVQLNGKSFTGGNPTFTPISKNLSFSDEKLNGNWQKRSTSQLLGMDVFEHTIERESGALFIQYVAKGLHFPQSYNYGDNFRSIFTKKGIALKLESVDKKGRQSITEIHEIVLTNCNCNLLLKELIFYENIDSSEGVLDLQEFLGN